LGKKEKDLSMKGKRNFLSILIKQNYAIHNLREKINRKRGTTGYVY